MSASIDPPRAKASSPRRTSPRIAGVGASSTRRTRAETPRGTVVNLFNASNASPLAASAPPVILPAESPRVEPVGKKAKKLSKAAKAPPGKAPSVKAPPHAATAAASDDDGSELDIPYAHAFDETQARLSSELSNVRKEPLRPGDVICYSNPLFGAGSKQGRRVTQILQTDPESEFPLDLDNGEYLLPETKIKRIREFRHGCLYKHEGITRPIEHFLYTKASLTPNEQEQLPGLQQQIERYRVIWCQATTTSIEAGPGWGRLR